MTSQQQRVWKELCLKAVMELDPKKQTGKPLPRSAAVQQVRAQGVGVSGGRKGGPARAAIMTPEQRSATASKAARTKWAKFRAKKKT